jgi:hypothetical protein
MKELKLKMSKNRVRVFDEFDCPIMDLNDSRKGQTEKKIAGLFEKFR